MGRRVGRRVGGEEGESPGRRVGGKEGGWGGGRVERRVGGEEEVGGRVDEEGEMK